MLIIKKAPAIKARVKPPVGESSIRPNLYEAGIRIGRKAANDKRMRLSEA